MTNEEKLNILGEDKKPSFCVVVDFPPNTQNPQRIFQAASNYITALHSLDRLLVDSITPDIKTVLVLESVESGSIKIFLQQFLNAIDDDALKTLDWKPAVGRYLVKGKYLILKALGESNGLPSRETLDNVVADIRGLAEETNVKRLPVYRGLTAKDIAEEAKELCATTKMLGSNETIVFSSDEGDTVLSSSFSVTQEDIAELFTENIITNTVEMILVVRKPDFLSNTKWEFRHQKRTLSASIKDIEWLNRYHSGNIDIRPGDALHVKILEEVAYGNDGEVVEERREVIEVIGIIRQNVQGSLI